MDRRHTAAGPNSRGGARLPLLSGLRAVASAFALILLLFAGYEVLERTLLSGLSMERLHVVHQVRGVLAALLAASIAAWLIARASPSLFLEGEAPGALRSAKRPASEPDRERRFAHWFILMRWIAVVVAAVLVFGAIRVMGYLPESLALPLSALLTVLVALNAVYALALRRGAPVRALLIAQAYGDLLVLTGLLHFSGGIENPLGTLMLFHVIIAGIVLSRGQCYLVAASASVLFALMAWAEWSGALSHYTLTIFPHAEAGGEHLHAALETEYVTSRVGLQAAVLLLTAYFTTTVTAQLQRRERQVQALANEALAQSQLLEQSLETTGTALCVCDRSLRETWVNPRWEVLVGRRGCGRLGAAVTLRARETLQDGSVHVGEVTLPGDDGGAPRTVLLTTAPLLNKEGEITHVVELARDVTEFRRIQERVARAEQLAAVGELAGKVAHEVNNPIAVISAKARLLLSRRRPELTDRTAEELEKIVDLSDKVAHIAGGLLSYSRPSHGARTLTDLRVPVRRALSMIETAAEAAGVEIRESIPGSLPPVEMNAAEIEQVFVNLFVNALDAMPDGGHLSVTAALGAEVEPASGAMHDPDDAAPHGLVVLVEDTGVGIPPELQAQVFEPFLTTKPEGEGTGLGLAICLGIVRSHGGAMELESEPGRGTTVRLRFPPAAAHADPPVHA